jgi:DNA-binding transcriptional LysR family regulator
MDVRPLRAFLVLSEHTHFTRAAAVLGLAQPALSKQISALEAELGVRLFDRTRRRVSLSREGRALVPVARRALAAFEDVETAATRLRAGTAGELIVGFTPSAPARRLPDLVQGFRRRHPEVSCVAVQAGSDALVDAVRQGQVDVALVRAEAAADRPGLRSARLDDESMVLVLPADHALAPRTRLALGQLADEPFVMVERQASRAIYDRVVAACRDAGFSPRIVQHVRDVHGVVAVVAIAGAVGLVPASEQSFKLPSIVYRELARPVVRTALALVWRADDRGPLVLDFVRGV